METLQDTSLCTRNRTEVRQHLSVSRKQDVCADRSHLVTHDEGRQQYATRTQLPPRMHSTNRSVNLWSAWGSRRRRGTRRGGGAGGTEVTHHQDESGTPRGGLEHGNAGTKAQSAAHQLRLHISKGGQAAHSAPLPPSLQLDLDCGARGGDSASARHLTGRRDTAAFQCVKAFIGSTTKTGKASGSGLR